MNKQELIAAVAEKTGSSKAAAQKSLEAVLDTVSGALKKGDAVQLIGFGTFEVRGRPARTGRNPQTGKEVKIKAKTIPAFKAGKALKDLVEKTKVAAKVATKAAK